MGYSYTEYPDGSLVVTLNRRLTEGVHYRINSSYGYAGITPGEISIAHIIYDIDNIHPDIDEKEHIEGYIESFIDAELSILDDEERDRHRTHLLNVPWIVYNYPFDKSEQGELYALPVDLFMAHLSGI